MNVITVRQGDKFGPEYTTMLSRMVGKHLRRKLLVLGDGEDADIGLAHGYKGWHAKLELFSPELKPYRPFIFFDLDSYILEDVLFLHRKYERLVLIKDFNRTNHSNSGMMIVPYETDEIWERRVTDVADGDFVNRFPHDTIQDLFPGLITSYKRHSREKPMSPIVLFHGFPKPHQIESGWAKEIWSSYGEKAVE